MDAPVVGAGHGAKLKAAIIRGVGLHHLGAMVGQAVLEIDAGDRRRQLAQIAGRGADQMTELPKTPMGGGDRLGLARQHESEPVRVISGCLDPHLTALERAGPRVIGARLHGAVQISEREKALVRGPGQPLRRDAPDPLAATDVDTVAGWLRGGAARV
jgi:hypothetical protein